MIEKWDSFFAPTGVSADTMMLLTDGTVLVHDAGRTYDSNNKITDGGKDWYRLAPNDDGTYKSDKWSVPYSMINARQFFASGILRDGRLFVLGGEYSDTFVQDACPRGEIFDPLANQWAAIAKPSPDFDFIAGDAPCSVLADGRVLFGSISDSRTVTWDPLTDDWSLAGRGNNPTGPESKNSPCDEETWTLLPDGSVLTVNVANPNSTQRYDPKKNVWIDSGATPQSLVVQQINGVTVGEIGPALLLPNGHVFAIGGTGHTAIFDPSQPTTLAWTKGPDLPMDSGNALAPAGLYTVIDGPACLLPGGQVLLVAGKTVAEVDSGVKSYWSNPTMFFKFDPSVFNPANPGTIPALAIPAPNSGSDCWTGSLLPLPNGQVLFSSQQNSISIYTPSATELTPRDAWRPVISGFPSIVTAGQTYALAGIQLNGLSQANSYGDDRQAATNYPLVRIADTVGRVRFLPTSKFSTMGVATGTSQQSANVFVPQKTPPGAYVLTVVVNGISSMPTNVTIKA